MHTGADQVVTLHRTAATLRKSPETGERSMQGEFFLFLAGVVGLVCMRTGLSLHIIRVMPDSCMHTHAAMHVSSPCP